jgi:hypothetical protein
MYRRLLELLKLVKPHQPHLPQTNVRRSFLPKGNKHEFNCNCGKKIIVMTNIYDNSNSGKGSCECGAVVYVN